MGQKFAAYFQFLGRALAAANFQSACFWFEHRLQACPTAPWRCIRSLLKEGTDSSVYAHRSTRFQRFACGDRVVCPLFNKLLANFRPFEAARESSKRL